MYIGTWCMEYNYSSFPGYNTQLLRGSIGIQLLFTMLTLWYGRSYVVLCVRGSVDCCQRKEAVT